MKKQMLMLVALVIMAVYVGGCEEDKITAKQVQELAAQVQELNAVVDGSQLAVSGLVDALQPIVGDEVAEKVEKASEEIDRVQPQVADIVAAIISADLGEDEVANWVRLLRTGTQASAPWNPYALPIAMGLDLVLLVWALFKRKQAADNKLKYQAHKQGTELTSLEKPDVAVSLYKNIGDARTSLGVK